MFIFSMFGHDARSAFQRCIYRMFNCMFGVLSPYIHLYIDEFSSDLSLTRTDDFMSIQAYINEHGSPHTKNFRLITRGNKRTLSLDLNEEMTDRCNGITVWWTLVVKKASSNKSYDRRSYKLTFHKKLRELIAGQYLDHVVNEGKMIREKNRTRRMYSNRNFSFHEFPWTHVTFKHPATFDNLAMDPQKKREIVVDLLKFKDSEEFYSRIGKAWKRGYLLYGPPGTGKSTMIAAMANLLEYDVYDLELTAVKDNAQLRKLLIHTSRRSIIAVEDIDCSLDVTGKRDLQKKSSSSSVGKAGKTSESSSSDEKISAVTLSGLLNFIDGLWSFLGGERIIVFTTNSVSKLDPALIRSGRMDKHIELSYCDFEAFKVLAKNYLLAEEHAKFDVIKAL